MSDILNNKPAAEPQPLWGCVFRPQHLPLPDIDRSQNLYGSKVGAQNLALQRFTALCAKSVREQAEVDVRRSAQKSSMHEFKVLVTIMHMLVLATSRWLASG